MTDTTGPASAVDGGTSAATESASYHPQHEQGRTSYDQAMYQQQQLLPGDESAAWQQQQQPYMQQQHQPQVSFAQMSMKRNAPAAGSAGAGSIASSIGPASVAGSEMSMQDHEAMLQHQQQQQHIPYGNGPPSMQPQYAEAQQAFYGPSGMQAHHAYPGAHPQAQFAAPPSSMMVPPGSPMMPGYALQQGMPPPPGSVTPGVPAPPGPGAAPRGGNAAPGMMQGPGSAGSMNYPAMMPMHPHAASMMMQQQQQPQQHYFPQPGSGNAGNTGGRAGQQHRGGQNAYGQYQHSFQQGRRPSAGSSPGGRNAPYYQQGNQSGGASGHRGGNYHNNMNNHHPTGSASSRGAAGYQQATLPPASSAPISAPNNPEAANSVFTRLPPLPPLPPAPEKPKDVNLPQQPWGLAGVLAGSDPVGALVRYTQQLESLVEAYKKREEARIMQIEALAFDPAVALRTITGERDQEADGAEKVTEDARASQALAPVLGIRLLQRVQELTEENEEIGKMLASKMGLDGDNAKAGTSTEQDNLAQELDDAHILIKQMDHALTSAEQALSIAVANNSVGISEELAKATRTLSINPTVSVPTGASFAHPSVSPIPDAGAPPQSSSQARPSQKERNANGGHGGSSRGGRGGGARGGGPEAKRPGDRTRSSASTRPSA